jgi:hypothetical protein
MLLPTPKALRIIAQGCRMFSRLPWAGKPALLYPEGVAVDIGLPVC